MNNEQMPNQTGMGESMGPGQAPQGAAAPEGDNPIVAALQDIGKFIAAQQEQQNPAAAGMMQHFSALLEAMRGGGEQPQEQEQPQPQARPEAPKGPAKQSPGGVGGNKMVAGGDMNAREGSVPVM